MARSNAERRKAYRARQADAGGRQVNVWLTAEAAAALDRLTSGGISTTFAVCSALEMWDAFVREANARMERITPDQLAETLADLGMAEEPPT